MTRFAEAKFTIRAINKTQKAFTEINKNIGNMDRKFSKFGRNINRVGGLFATAFVGKQITNVITKFEKLEASLRTVTGSAKNANIAFSFIQNFASKTPFQLEEVTDAFIKLKALGLNPSEEALTSYGNTATAMGKSLNQMIEAVADATTGEFERLKEFGIKAKSQGDQVTFTFQGVSTTIQKNAEEIEGYLRSIGDLQFAGAMQEQAKTLNVSLSNMKDAFSKLAKAIGDAGLTDILMGMANGIKWLAEQITKAIPIMKLGFQSIIVGIQQFANDFLARLIGLGRAISAFFDDIGNRFNAFGKDIAKFFKNPLDGVSLTNTKEAFSKSLSKTMSEAYEEMIEVADEQNSKLDKKLGESLDKFITSQGQKVSSLKNLLKPNKETTNKQDNSNDNLQNKSKETKDVIVSEFDSLGKSMENSIINSLDAINGEFDNFGDFFKNFMSDLNKSLLQVALKDLNVTGNNGLINNIFGGMGGLFGGKGNLGTGNILSGISSFFGGFFADGGTLKAGQFGVVGERGPELAFSGSRPMQISPNNSAPVTINMNIQTPDIQSFRQSQNQITADMARSIERSKRNL